MIEESRELADFSHWMALLLDCLRAVGGSARPREVLPWMRERSGLTQVLLDSQLNSGQTRFYNRVHWARQSLVWASFRSS